MKEILFSEKVAVSDKFKISKFLLAFQGYNGSEQIRDELLKVASSDRFCKELRIEAASVVLEDDVM